MDADTFKAMVARLEAESAAAPGAYRAKVAALAVLGFGILALLIATAGLGLVLLAGFVIAVVVSGGAALILLLKLGKLVLLLALPLWYLVRSGAQALFVRLPPPQGEPVTRAQAPALWQAIDGMRQRMKGPRVHQVLIVDEVNAAVVQQPAFGLMGFPRNHLLLGLPLLEGMAPEEALAVVAHEYGHLAGSHGRFGAWIYRLRHTWGTIQAHAEQMKGWLARLVLPLVRWYAPYFNAYTFVLARANEYEADAASAELVGPAAAAHALKRVNLVAPRYDAFLDQTFERMRDEARPPADLGQRWAQQAQLAPPGEDAQRWLAEALDRESHFADTHPVLRARLQALPGLAEEAAAVPPPHEGPSAAEAWLGPLLPTLRRAFESAWAERVAQPWVERHEQIQKDRQRLAELRGRGDGTLPLDERYEMLRLQTALEPAVDQREAWAAFNADHPDHAGGLFFEGAERLHHDDAAGVALLERAMALDAELTKPGCERVHGYLRKQKDPAAETWAERWRARDALESQVAHELQQLHTAHRLVAADEDTRAAVRAMLADKALLADVAEVYFARRELPSDASVKTYVLALRLTWWGRSRSRQQQVVDRLAGLSWPVHLFVCTLEGDYAALKDRLKRLPDARIA